MGGPGYDVARGAIPQPLVDDALRLLHRDLLEQGATSAQLSEWLWAMHWFPHLVYRDEIKALAAALPPHWSTGEICDPQILLQFPHTGDDEPEIVFHTDQEPGWAGGRRYIRIVGVALSPWRSDNGGLIVQDGGTAVPVELEPGDAVCMSPDMPHSGGLNRTGSIRYGVYFRFLQP